jgi:predicted RNA-binding protein YlxR (DUF448 family)
MSEPVRTCIGCGARKPKGSLVRLVATDGQARVDLGKKLPGRGAYLCDATCAEKAIARKVLGRAFKRQVSSGCSLAEQVRQADGASAPGR